MTLLPTLLAAANLLVNPSFEDWPEGEPLPRHWVTERFAKPCERISRVVAQGTDGEISVAIQNGTLYEYLGQYVPVEPGKRYDISVDVKTDLSAYQFRIMPYWVDADGKQLPNANVPAGCPYAETKTPWTKLSLRNYLAPTNAAKLFLRLSPNDCHRWCGCPGVMCIDNACVSESAGIRKDRPVRPVASTDVEVLRAELGPDRDTAGVLVRTGAKGVRVRLVAEEPLEDGLVALGADRTAAIPAKCERSIVVPLDTRSPQTRLTVYADGRPVWRKAWQGKEDFLKIGLRDPFNVRKGEIFVPNDARWYVDMPIQHTLKYWMKPSGRTYGNPTNVNARLFVEVPEGVSVPFIKYAELGGDTPLRMAEATTETTWNGRRMTRSRFPGFISGDYDPQIFFTSTLPTDTRVPVRVWMAWDGGEQVPLELNARIVSYGRVKPFERMQLRLDRLQPAMAYALADDPAHELPTLGVNVFRVPPSPSDDPYVRYKETNETFGQRLKRMVADMRASGLTWYFCIPNHLPLEAWGNDIHWRDPMKLRADPSAHFLRRDGKPFKNGEGWIPPCPNYRGTNFLATAKFVRECEAVRDYGVRWLVCDWEFWQNEPCYCDRCVKLFRGTWTKERGLPDFGDPREFMADEKANPEAAKAYRDFYWWSRGRMYTDFKTELAKDGLGTFTISEWTRPAPGLMDGVDVFDWSFGYGSPEAKLPGVELIFTNVLKGVTGNYTCSVAPMQSCETCYVYPPISTYYNILEAATLGVRGFEWFFVKKTESMTWKYVMDGLREIRPFEDIVLDGRVTIRGEGRGCSWRRIVKGGEALFCVRDYLLKGPKTVELSMKVKHEASVWECATGRKLADLAKGENAVRISLDPDHLAKLIYVGNRFEERRRAAAYVK